MEVSKQAITAKFDEVLSESVSREAVSDWARVRREADDDGTLTLLPEAERSRLWDALLFLEGVDLKDSPTSYLHNEEDILRERPT